MIVAVRCNECLDIWIMRFNDDNVMCCPYCGTIGGTVSWRDNIERWSDAVIEFSEEERGEYEEWDN